MLKFKYCYCSLKEFLRKRKKSRIIQDIKRKERWGMKCCFYCVVNQKVKNKRWDENKIFVVNGCVFLVKNVLRSLKGIGKVGLFIKGDIFFWQVQFVVFFGIMFC